MRGVILAGGAGTRLRPLTLAVNKHLVPVGNLPMIEYPLYTIRQLGVEYINIVTGGEHFKEIGGYLTEMHKRIKFSCHYQNSPGGIAQALSLTEGFVNEDKIAVILGDNIFENNFINSAKKFEESSLGAMLFLCKVNDPERYGVAEIKNEKIIGIEEKPKSPKSNLAVTGLYFYDSTIFDKIKKLKPSKRGELEITDVNNLYLNEERLHYSVIEGFWSDAGTVSSRKKCTEFVINSLEKKVIESLDNDIKKSLPEELSNTC